MALESKYISWPNEREREDLVQSTFFELPRCIGYVDGTEVNLAETPSLDHTSYYSRKQRYSIKAQVIKISFSICIYILGVDIRK